MMAVGHHASCFASTYGSELDGFGLMVDGEFSCHRHDGSDRESRISIVLLVQYLHTLVIELKNVEELGSRG